MGTRVGGVTSHGATVPAAWVPFLSLARRWAAQSLQPSPSPGAAACCGVTSRLPGDRWCWALPRPLPGFPCFIPWGALRSSCVPFLRSVPSLVFRERGGGEKSGTETLISHLSHTLPGWGVPPRSPGARTSRDLRASARLCLLFTGHVPRFWQGQSHSVRAEPSTSCAGVCWWVQGPRPCATRPPACSRAQSARSSALPGALRAAVSAGSAVLLEPCRRAALGGWSPGGRPAVPPPSGSRHQPACRPPPVPLLGRRWSGRWT